jgi:hypothetical protein
MPEQAAELIGGLSISPHAIMAILMVFYILLGGVAADFIRLAALTVFPGITLFLVRLLS